MADTEQPAAKKQKCDTGSTFDLSHFSNVEAVRKLAGAGERLVCLQFPEELGSLYCHSCFLSFSSPVLRNVLEDTAHQQDQLCTIPLAGDSDLSVWRLALGLIYRLETATITLDNAQALLLLAHKYDMRSMTVEVGRYLLAKDTPAAADSRLKSHLSASTVNSWLATASKCGQDTLLQPCIEYVVSQNLPVDMELLNSLEAPDAGQLLAALQREITQANSKLSQARNETSIARTKLASAKCTLYTVAKHIGKDDVAAALRGVTGYSCSTCNRRWISNHSFQRCCNAVTAKETLYLLLE